MLLLVALIVRKGGCTLEEKALVASTLVYPPGVVQYIIVDGDKNLRNLNKNHPEQQQQQPLVITQEQDGVVSRDDEDLLGWYDEMPLIQVRGVELGDRYDDDDDESSSLVPYPSRQEEEEERSQPLGEDDLPNDDDDDESSIMMTSLQHVQNPTTTVLQEEQDTFLPNDDESIPTFRTLRKKKKHDDITVAVLRVSYNAGYELLDFVLRESKATRDMGGPKIVMDSKEPNASAKTIFLWVLMSASLSASACLCLVLFVNRGVYSPEEQAAAGAPRPPVRRRLTHDQVRDKYPAFSFQETCITTRGGEPVDDCAICLDEFLQGNQCRQLPCQHVFHGTCIARWLIERSATCPLCKVDLYEDDESSSNSSSSAEAAPLDTSWWGGMISRASSSQEQQQQPPVTNNNQTAATTTTALPQIIQTQTSWWRRRQEQSAVGTADQTETTRPSRSLWFSFDGWRGNLFGQRRDASEGALTELTEPLLVDNREQGPAVQVQADEVSSSSPVSAVESSSPAPTPTEESSASTVTSPSEIEPTRPATSAEI
jgi:hypothetical protein